MKTVLSTLAAAMIATASFAGAALAEGDYYDGATKTQAAAKVDNVKTGSIAHVRASKKGDIRSVFEANNGDSH